MENSSTVAFAEKGSPRLVGNRLELWCSQDRAQLPNWQLEIIFGLWVRACPDLCPLLPCHGTSSHHQPTFNFHWLRRVVPARGPGPIRASVGPALQCERDRCCNTMLWSAVAATFVLAGESQPQRFSWVPPIDIPSKSPKCFPLPPYHHLRHSVQSLPV